LAEAESFAHPAIGLNAAQPAVTMHCGKREGKKEKGKKRRESSHA